MNFAYSLGLIVLSFLLMIVVLLQGKGSGVGMAFGGDSNMYRTKRGVDRVLSIATIVLAALLFVGTLARAFFTLS